MHAAGSQSNSHNTRKRAPRACVRCRARKVRCDTTSKVGDCTNCRLDGEVCIPTEERKARLQWVDGLKRRRPNGSHNEHVFEDASTTNQPMRSLAVSASGKDRAQNHMARTSRVPKGSPEQLFHEVEHISPLGTEFTHGLVPSPAAAGLAPFSRSHAVNASSVTKCSDFGCTQSITFEAASGSKGVLPAYISPLPESITAEDFEYLHVKGALTIPDISLRNQLLQSFVEYVYPFLPLINLEEFMGIIQQGDGKNGQVSLLVFQAVMLAGSGFIDMQYLQSSGCQHRNARQTLFRKVKLLYQFDVEPSSTHLIQALLLMTYGFEEIHEPKDMWYWMSIVVTLSHTSGLHHCPQREDSSEAENRLNRRLWWCVFMRNQLVAFGMRRRARVRYKNRIPMLTVSDFECGLMPTRITDVWKDCLILRDPVQRKQLAGLCIEQCKLIVCVAEVMYSQFQTRSLVLPRGAGTMPMLIPKQSYDTNINSSPYIRRLDEWAENLPPVYQYNSMTSVSGYESEVMIVHKAILRMLYVTAVGAFQYPYILPVSPATTSISMALEAAKHMEENSKTTLRCIAEGIMHVTMDLQSLNLIHCLPSTCLSPMLATMLLQIIDIQSLSGVISPKILQQFSNYASVMRALCENYPVAEPVLLFLEETATVDNILLCPPLISSTRLDQLANPMHAPTTEPQEKIIRPNPKEFPDHLESQQLAICPSDTVADPLLRVPNLDFEDLDLTSLESHLNDSKLDNIIESSMPSDITISSDIWELDVGGFGAGEDWLIDNL